MKGRAPIETPPINTMPSDTPLVDRYVSAYVAGNGTPKPSMVDKVLNDKKVSFSWFAFFLWPYYLVYRKLYLVALIAFLGIQVVGFLPFSDLAFNGISLALSAAMGFAFYPLYRRKAAKDIEEVLARSPENAVLGEVRLKGGTSLKALFIALGLAFLFAFIIVWFFDPGIEQIQAEVAAQQSQTGELPDWAQGMMDEQRNERERIF